jgi:hypothetical protein
MIFIFPRENELIFLKKWKYPWKNMVPKLFIFPWEIRNPIEKCGCQISP